MSEKENQLHGHDSYKIIVDHKPHDWPKAMITGLEIKVLAGVDPNTYDAWQDMPGREDKLIVNEEMVNLTPNRVEKFFTGKRTTTEG